MGFLDGLLGRRKAARPNLDALFSVPSAALTLRAAAGFEPTGNGTVCFRAAAGPAFAQVADEVLSGRAPDLTPAGRALAAEHDLRAIAGRLLHTLRVLNSPPTAISLRASETANAAKSA